MKIRQIDIKSAFIHGALEQPVYMTLPQSSNIDIAVRATHFYKFRKSSYGLEVAPQC